MPCFGLDIGGTLTKLVYFEPQDEYIRSTKQEAIGLQAIQEFITSHVHYGETGVRDEELEIKDVIIGDRKGTLHFIRFSTCQMSAFIELSKEMNAAVCDSKVCATGGGAFKFEKEFSQASICVFVNLIVFKFFWIEFGTCEI